MLDSSGYFFDIFAHIYAFNEIILIERDLVYY